MSIGEKNDTTRSAILVLAAGASSRLGQSKQLLVINEISLLEKTIQEALDSQVGFVFVVLGAGWQKHQAAISHLGVKTFFNRDWEKGMGNSLKNGLSELIRQHPNLESVLVLVCDQPALTHQHLTTLHRTWQKDKTEIVASHYGNILGVPALFYRSVFDHILALPDESGAKKLVNSWTGRVEAVDFHEGEFDIDTPADLEKWRAQQKNSNSSASADS